LIKQSEKYEFEQKELVSVTNSTLAQFLILNLEVKFIIHGGFVGVLLLRLIFNYAGVTTDDEWQ